MSGWGNPQISGLRFSFQPDTYQFIGTSDHLYQTYANPSGRYWLESYVTTVSPKVKLQDGVFVIELKVKPWFSSLESPPIAEWEYGPITRLEEDGSEPMKIRPAYQVDGTGPRQWFSSDASTIPWIFTSFGQALPDNGMFGYSASALTRRVIYDIGYDYPPTHFRGIHGRYKAPYPTDFWRNAAFLKVSSELFTDRSFIIMVDANNQFTAFPILAPTELTYIDSTSGSIEAIIADYSNTQDCPWPDWANLTSTGKAVLGSSYDAIPQSEYSRLRLPTWEFSHDGRYAACVTAHRASAWSDSLYSSKAYDGDGNEIYSCLEDYPGLVEVEFTITVTGEDLADFTFSVSLKQDYCSLTDLRIPVMVGYAVKDFPSKSVSVNDLLVLEYQFYCTPESMAESDADSNGFRVPKRPAIATTAQVKKGATVIDEWLAYYGVYPDLSRVIDPRPPYRTVIPQTDECRPFYPRFEDLWTLGSSESIQLNHFRFITHLVAMDLSTLSWVLGCSLKTEALVFDDVIIDYNRYEAEAVLVSTTAFGSLVENQTIGYPSLKTEIVKLFEGTSTYPDLDAMKPFYATSTIDMDNSGVSIPTLYPPDSPTPLEENSDYAELTIHYTESDAVTTTIKEASFPFYMPSGYWYDSWYLQFGVRAYVNITESGVFPTSSAFELTDTAVLSPTVFSFFDEIPTLRPGVTWYTGLDAYTPVQESGTLSFTGYPFGAIAISRVIGLTGRALNAVSQRLVTHPSGSWSCFAGPFCASSDLISKTLSGGWSWDSGSYEQIIVDQLVFQSEYSDGTVKATKETTHLEQFNSAFGKALTSASYYLPIQDASVYGIEVKPNFTYGSYTTRWYLKDEPSPIGPEWTDNVVVGWYLSNRISMGLDFQIETNTINSPIFPNPRMMAAFHMNRL